MATGMTRGGLDTGNECVDALKLKTRMWNLLGAAHVIAGLE